MIGTNQAETDNSSRDYPPGRRLRLLEDVKVLDLTGYLAGPYATQILADMGAEVTKVESRAGDLTRQNPPYFFEGDSAYYLAVNRNKRSIVLNLRSPEAREVLARLIRQSDVVMDNMRAARRSELALDFDSLAKINPRIVSCSLTGFGSDGPYRDRPAYDIIVEAMAGVMSLTGPEGGPSVRAGVPIGDITAGLYAVIGILGGLEYRRNTGKGTHIDIAMLDCQVSLLSYLAQYFLTGGYVATHQGRAHVSVPTYNTFATKDGREIVIAANTDAMWRSLCKVLNRPESADDPRFADLAGRLAHREEVLEIVAGAFAERDCDELIAALVEADIPAAVINSVDAALEDEQVRHREMVVEAPHWSGKTFPTLGTPIRAENAWGHDFSTPPRLGADTQAVLSELGFTASEIAALQEAGAVFADPGNRTGGQGDASAAPIT